MADAGTTTAHISAALVLIPIDPERARKLLLAHAQDRLERLASRILNGFRPIRARGWETGDLLNTMYLRLLREWDKTVTDKDGQPIREPAVYLRNVSRLLRVVLLDESRKVNGRLRREPDKPTPPGGQEATGKGPTDEVDSPSPSPAVDVSKGEKRRPKMLPLIVGDGEHAHDPGSDTNDPAQLAVWTEFHRIVDELPDDLRAVVDLRYYQELPHEEVGELLKVAEVTARKKWLRARLKLVERLGANPFEESEA